MARSNIIKNFINSNMDINTALQNLLAILWCFKDEKLINWVNKELSGYNQGDELPEYRVVKGRFMASYLVGPLEYSMREFGIKHLDKDMQENLLTSCIYSSISTLEKTVNTVNKKEASMMKSVPPEWYSFLQSNTNAHITNARVEIDMGVISDIISKVRTKILDTLLYLEEEFGNLDDLDIDISTKGNKELTDIIEHIQINLYDNSITIGNNNKINKSDITTNK